MKMKKYHQVSSIEICSGVLRLTVDGKRIERKLELISPALAKASRAEQLKYELSPSGYGIHWPLIDEDISIDGLLGISHQREPKLRIA